jgi:RNA polymerase sigma-70 factor, ECF subfamily
MSDSDPEGFAKLFSESRAALRRYVLRLVRSREATEEIVQEAFLRTYEQRADVQTPRALLFSIARNLASNARRHERVTQMLPLEDPEATQTYSDQQSPEQTALSDERIRLLKEAIERLPPQCRSAFALKVLYDCSYQEIAERLRLSKKTVEKHISLGLRATNADLKRHYCQSNTGTE